MNKFLLIGSIFAFIMMAGMVSATTYECDSCSSCQTALDGASTNDIIQLNASFSNSGDCMTISTDNVTLDCQGFTITGDNSTGIGIFVDSTNYVTVQNCIIKDFENGIALDYTNTTTVRNNTIQNSIEDGIIFNCFVQTDRNSFYGNTITNSGISGIQFVTAPSYDAFCNNNTINNNIFFNSVNFQCWDGDANIEDSSQCTNTFYSNTFECDSYSSCQDAIDNAEVGDVIYMTASISESGFTVDGLSGFVFDCDGNDITASGYAFDLINTDNVTIQNCRLSRGFFIEQDSQFNTIRNIESTGDGDDYVGQFMRVENSPNNVFMDITWNYLNDGNMFISVQYSDDIVLENISCYTDVSVDFAYIENSNNFFASDLDFESSTNGGILNFYHVNDSIVDGMRVDSNGGQFFGGSFVNNVTVKNVIVDGGSTFGSLYGITYSSNNLLDNLVVTDPEADICSSNDGCIRVQGQNPWNPVENNTIRNLYLGSITGGDANSGGINIIESNGTVMENISIARDGVSDYAFIKMEKTSNNVLKNWDVLDHSNQVFATLGDVDDQVMNNTFEDMEIYCTANGEGWELNGGRYNIFDNIRMYGVGVGTAIGAQNQHSGIGYNVFKNLYIDNFMTDVVIGESGDVIRDSYLSGTGSGISYYSVENTLTRNVTIDLADNGDAYVFRMDGIGEDANNTITDCNVQAIDGYLLYLSNVQSDGFLVYNNIFTVGDYIYDSDGSSLASMNTTKTLENNIVGGSYLGGNYWADFSPDCLDADFDGICDYAYDIGSDSIDWLPLTNQCYAPVVTIVSPEDGVTYNMTSIDLLVSSDNDANIETWFYSLDGSEIESFAPNISLSVSVGSHNLTVYADNICGNRGTATSLFNVSSPVPSTPNITVTYPIDGHTYDVSVLGRIVNLTVSSDMSMSSWWYSLNGGSFTYWDGSVINISSRDGMNTIAVYGNSTGGVVGSTVVTYYIANPYFTLVCDQALYRVYGNTFVAYCNITNPHEYKIKLPIEFWFDSMKAQFGQNPDITLIQYRKFYEDKDKKWKDWEKFLFDDKKDPTKVAIKSDKMWDIDKYKTMEFKIYITVPYGSSGEWAVLMGKSELDPYWSSVDSPLVDAGYGLGNFLSSITNPLVNIVLGLGIVGGILAVLYGLSSAIRRAVGGATQSLK